MEYWFLAMAIGLTGLFVAWVALRIFFVRKAGSIKRRIRELDDFGADDVYVSDQNLGGIAIDLKRREILLTDAEEFRRFTVPSIVSCEILEDDVQLAYANRGSQLAGVAVGGILLGGVGAVIGGLSGSKRTVNKVRKMILRFVTDDFKKPNHDIVLLDWIHDKEGVPRDSQVYRQALEAAELWHSRVRAMMKVG